MSSISPSARRRRKDVAFRVAPRPAVVVISRLIGGGVVVGGGGGGGGKSRGKIKVYSPLVVVVPVRHVVAGVVVSEEARTLVQPRVNNLEGYPD